MKTPSLFLKGWVLVVLLFCVLIMLGAKCQIVGSAEELPEGVRHVRIVESLQTGVRIQAQDGVIVREIPCYDGDPTRKCIWMGCDPTAPGGPDAPEETAVTEESAAEEPDSAS